MECEYHRCDIHLHFPINSENFFVCTFSSTQMSSFEMSESFVHLFILFFFSFVFVKSWYTLDKTAFSSLHVFPVSGLSLCGLDVVFCEQKVYIFII